MNQSAPSTAKPQFNNAAWPYRCFVLMPSKKGWRADNGLEYLPADIPRRFYWSDREDRDTLCTFIDLITAGRKGEAREYIERGLAYDLEYDPEPVTGTIKMQFERFMDFLAFRGHIDLPLKYKVQFVGKGGRQLVPAEFITTLMKYTPNPEWFGNPNDWHWVRRDELNEIDPNGMSISSCMYRGARNMVDTADDVAAMEAEGLTADSIPSIRRYRRRPAKPPRETEIKREMFGKHFELVTAAIPARGATYFTRRLLTYQGQLLWSGTSFKPEGPWTECERDSALLLALGVDV